MPQCRSWDNKAFRFLIGSDLEGYCERDRNCMWLTFTDPSWREATVDWPEVAAQMVANLRVAAADHPGEVPWDRLIDRLRQASPAFRELWDARTVRPLPESLRKSYRHHDLGQLEYDGVNSWLTPRRGLRMIVYTPADDRTSQLLVAAAHDRSRPSLEVTLSASPPAGPASAA